MATLIPALGTCVARMTSGERRWAERLQDKLEDDYLLWWDVPIGPKQTRPDFVVLHPRRGALILEVKDWRLDTIRRATREYFEIAPDGTPKVVMSPLQQARHCAIQVVNALERDPQLVQGAGPYQGKLALEWPVVAVMAERGADNAKGVENQDAILEARVVYVATTRAMQRLLVL